MKRTRAEGGALPPSKSAADVPAKAPRRQKALAAAAATTTPRSAAAAERAKARAAENAARKANGGDDKSLAAGDLLLEPSSSLPSAAAEADAEAGMGWAAEQLGEWWWCLSSVEEDKLSGWFPFVDEDFFGSDSRGGIGEAASGGLLWEEADHDIWQLQHIHEIPQTVSK